MRTTALGGVNGTLCICVVMVTWLAMMPVGQAQVTGPPPGARVFPTAMFDDSGTLWVTWVEDSHARSEDRGSTFSPGVRVTQAPEPIDANGDARPKVAIGQDGEVFVAWTRTGTRPYTGDIRFARSMDGGRTFSAPRVINDDGLAIGHRFETLAVNALGDVFLVWIDKRDLDAAQAAKEEYAGAALYYSWSTDAGHTFTANTKIKDNICECCRIAVEFEEGRWPVLMWRDVLEGSIRDHRVLRFLSRDEILPFGRVAVDNWQVEACPHHGPGLAIDSEGTYHAVWATGDSPRGPGSFYAQSPDGGRTFSEPTPIGSPETLGHADVVALGRRVAVAWKQRSPEGRTAILIRSSVDGGLTWTEPAEVARTSGGSDHPLLLSDGRELFLSWHTTDEGFRLVPLSHAGTH